MYLICSLLTLFMCQFIKSIIYIIKNKKFNFLIVISSGGFPSAHASFITSITTLIGLKEGFNSSIFALALVFTLITCYDAINVRYESGRHAKVLNEKFNLKMKVNIGHQLIEVIAGVILGIIVATIFYIW